jgi:hypothetical protein
MAYNRYSNFIKKDGSLTRIPFIAIAPSSSDKFVAYHLGKSRLDRISYSEYGDPNYEWLILQANPTYGFFEFNIPDGALLRIPYPLENAIRTYESELQKYKILNGLN